MDIWDEMGCLRMRDTIRSENIHINDYKNGEHWARTIKLVESYKARHIDDGIPDNPVKKSKKKNRNFDDFYQRQIDSTKIRNAEPKKVKTNHPFIDPNSYAIAKKSSNSVSIFDIRPKVDYNEENSPRECRSTTTFRFKDSLILEYQKKKRIEELKKKIDDDMMGSHKKFIPRKAPKSDIERREQKTNVICQETTISNPVVTKTAKLGVLPRYLEDLCSIVCPEKERKRKPHNQDLGVNILA